MDGELEPVLAEQLTRHLEHRKEEVMKMFRKASVQNPGSAALALLTLFAAMAPSAIAKPRPAKPAGQLATVRWDAETAYTNYGRSLVYIANDEGLGILEDKQPPLRWDAETAYTNYGRSLVYIANNEGLRILEHKQPPEPARLKWDAETAYTNY